MKKWMLPLLAAVLATGVSVMRAQQYIISYDLVDGLIKPAGNLPVFMYILFALSAAVLTVLGVGVRYKRESMKKQSFYNKSMAYFVTCCLAGVLLVAASAVGVKSFFDTRDVFVIISSIGAFLTGVFLLFLGRAYITGNRTDSVAVLNTLPIFWCAIWLVALYRQRSIEPILQEYIFSIVAVILFMFFVYYQAGFCFGKYNVRTVICLGLLAGLVGLFCGLPPLFIRIMEPGNQIIFNYFDVFAMLGMSIFALANASVLLANTQKKPVPEQL